MARRNLCGLLGLMVLTACVHAGDGKPANMGDDGAVQDPDPEEDNGSPKFCNPTGKEGAALKQCYEQNEAIYRTFDEEAKRREPWFNFTPDSWIASQQLDEKYVLPVVNEGEAVGKLEKTPIVELTPAEAKHLAGNAPTYPGLKPYLVRALMYVKSTGGFSVFEKNQAIYVRHDSLGTMTPKETRTALVVYLGFKPKEVYVDCQVAE